MSIEEQIRQYMAKNLLFSEDGFGYDNDTSFLREGLIDSMGVLELVMYVSSSFGIQVDPLDVTPDNFDSVNKLARYIRRGQAVLTAPENLEAGAPC